MSYKLNTTKNYALFSASSENRPVRLDTSKRRKLRKSMQKYGFLPAYPVHVERADGKLIVKDGQHRLAIAQEFGLPVYYVIGDRSISVPEINNTQLGWNAYDYLGAFEAAGNKHYVELREFCKMHGIPVATAVAIMANNSAPRHVMSKFYSGQFTVTSRALADKVAYLYCQLGKLEPTVKTRFLLAALFAVCLVDGFDADRLIKGAKKLPEDLRKYGSRDGYLEMLERLYNICQRRRVPLKMLAEDALRHRNPANRGSQNAGSTSQASRKSRSESGR